MAKQEGETFYIFFVKENQAQSVRIMIFFFFFFPLFSF